MQDESGTSWGMRGLRKWLGTAPETRDELLKIVQDSRRLLEPDTVAMLEGIFELPATKIREVMTPRTSMVSLQEDDDLLDILPVLIESAHSRFPVFSNDQPDNVVGILLAKDLLPFLTSRDSNITVHALMRQPIFVPESARSDQVLRMLKNTQTHIAIVIDEYGTTSGLVTLEDILEEIVGEIQDEFDEERPAIEMRGEDLFSVDGRLILDEVNDALGAHLESEDVDTLGGWLYSRVEIPPRVGQTVQEDGYIFTVEECDGSRITRVLVRCLPPITEEDESASKNS